MRRLRAALWGVAVATALVAHVALADATPVQLVLLYVPNVSTTGTQAASGIAELVLPEGEVRIEATNLPRLDGDQQYVAWIVNTETNAFERIGNFNTSQSAGAVHYENVLSDAIPTDKHWNLLLLTVEDGPEPAKPGPRHSIAGVFPSADNVPLPGVLPNTGGDPVVLPNEANWPFNLGLPSLTLAVGFAAGYVARSRRLAR
jgi:hypothetical protein